MPAGFYIAVLGAVLAGPIYIVSMLHMTWRMHARYARDWERRADFHAAQLEHLYAVDLAEAPLELRRFIERFRDQDKRNLARCSRNADRELSQIPERLREYYLSRAG